MKGGQAFSDLCTKLIENERFPYLNPVIERTCSTDWRAQLFSAPPPGRKELASGQADTLDEACARCVADYHERIAVAARKAELLKQPLVQEAMKLFKVKTEEGAK